jgi:4-diphosphocytidyl-2-C-methyl-D-erythritol kinase
VGEQLGLEAPGKINLTLDVLRRRDDGYHEVETILQSIDLVDRLVISRFAARIDLVTDCPDLPVDSTNLASRAARVLLDGSGAGVKIKLEKNIPVAAGLAGGSTDAAATLVGINQLLGLGLSRSRLKDLAVPLGADVPFCLEGGTLLAAGIGEKFETLPHPPDFWLVLVKPPFGVSTAEAYRRLNPGRLSRRPDTRGMINGIRKKDLDRMIACLGNVLEPVVASIYPQIESVKSDLAAAGALGVQMSGSGPTVFGIFRDRDFARQAGKELQNLYLRAPSRSGYRVFVTRNRQEGITVRRGEHGTEAAHPGETGQL